MIQEICVIDDNGADLIVDIRKAFMEKNEKIKLTLKTTSNSSKSHSIDVMKEMVQYYIRRPFESEYVYYLIKNFLELLQVNRRISPLTGLPRKCTNTSRN